MSTERVKITVDNSIKANDLDPAQLAFISFGSLCGMGLAFLLSFIITGDWARMKLGI